LQTYLGHRNIQNTAPYTALAPDRFKNFSFESAQAVAAFGKKLIA
jgi:hypothetical protein